MRSVSLVTILFAVSILMFAETAVAETTFDGTWSVTTNVHDYKNPNGTMSRAYTWQFPMTVKNGVLHGERGKRGSYDFLEINGTITADGDATIQAEGITGKGTEFTKGHTAAGNRYTYTVTAHFKGRQGTGQSVSDARTRIFTFVKN